LNYTRIGAHIFCGKCMVRFAHGAPSKGD